MQPRDCRLSSSSQRRSGTLLVERFSKLSPSNSVLVTVEPEACSERSSVTTGHSALMLHLGAWIRNVVIATIPVTRSIQTVVSGPYDKLDQTRLLYGPNRTIADILDDLIVRRTVLNHSIKLMCKPVVTVAEAKEIQAIKRRWRSAKRTPQRIYPKRLPRAQGRAIRAKSEIAKAGLLTYFCPSVHRLGAGAAPLCVPAPFHAETCHVVHI
jgi:hypothetical protein